MTGKTRQVLITKEGFDELNKFIGKLGKVSKRMNCRSLVLEHAVFKLNDSDVPKIVGRLFTTKDKFDELLAKVNAERPDNPIGQNELLETLISNYTSVHKLKKNKDSEAS